ncbi:hypothetical protein [Nostoc sp.]|uniref:hypothetical protein n=1 Tax=Nostoc sp. TaxID=1180 RepID=UPI002FF6BFF7
MGRINLFRCIILFSSDRYLLPLEFLYKLSLRLWRIGQTLILAGYDKLWAIA